MRFASPVTTAALAVLLSCAFVTQAETLELRAERFVMRDGVIYKQP